MYFLKVQVVKVVKIVLNSNLSYKINCYNMVCTFQEFQLIIIYFIQQVFIK